MERSHANHHALHQERKSLAKKYDASAPKVGELAPDFGLTDVNGNNRVCLSDFRDQKPVALVFGSFT